jgi:SAM-dependent methyltransferase
VCGNTGGDLVIRHPEGESLDVLRCPRCGVMGSRELPTLEQVSAYYQDQYYRSTDGRRFPAPMEAAVSWFRTRRAREAQRRCPAGGSVLDVGCGRGLILASLRRRGFRVFGTQLSRTAAEAIRSRFGIEVFVGELQDAGFAPESMDVALILHVLEHTRDPLGYLRLLHDVLKPGGHLLVEVPNAGCPTAQRYGLDWLHWDIPHHLYHFDLAGLRWLLGTAGFEVESVRTFSLEYGPFGVMQAWLNRLFRGRRHFFYRHLSGLERDARLFAVQAVVAACLLPAALCYCAVQSARGQGEVLTVWCRRR